MTLPLALGLRRDRDRIRAEEREAANAGDLRRALARCCEAAALDVDIAEAETAATLAALCVDRMMSEVWL